MSKCDAVVGEFAWFSQTCHNEAVTTVQQDGQTFNACEEHASP